MYSIRRFLAPAAVVAAGCVLAACSTAAEQLSPDTGTAKSVRQEAVDARLAEVADAWAATRDPGALLAQSESSGRPVAPAGVEPAERGSAPGNWTHVLMFMGYYAQGNDLRVSYSMPCRGGAVIDARAKETDTVVVVAILLGPPSQAAAPSASADAIGCSAAGRSGTADLTLAEPLGDRIVVDAKTGAGVFRSDEPLP